MATEVNDGRRIGRCPPGEPEADVGVPGSDRFERLGDCAEDVVGELVPDAASFKRNSTHICEND